VVVTLLRDKQAGAQAFDLAAIGKTVDAPSFAHLAKGEYHGGPSELKHHENASLDTSRPFCHGPTILDEDWLGNARIVSSIIGRTVLADRAFAPFGEMYNNFGSTTQDETMFTGDTEDILGTSDCCFDTPNRELSAGQGRWLSPDAAGFSAVDPSNPQSWNRYAYVMNNPVTYTDPTGLDYGFPTRLYSLDAVSNDGSIYMIDGLQVSQGAFMSQLDAGNGAGGGEFWATSNGNGHWVQVGGIGCDASMMCALPIVDWSADLPDLSLLAANNAPSNVSCNSTTGICVPAKMIPPPGYSPVKNAVKWYLCGNGPFDNIKNYTLEGLGKGALVGGFLGSEFGPAGTFLGATGGAVEGFFSGDAVGWVAAAGCQAAGMYGPAS